MAVNELNWNDTSPAAAGSGLNVKFQAATPDSNPSVVRNSSAYVTLATTSAPGIVPTLPNDDTKFFDGKGNFTTPSGGGGGGVPSGSNIAHVVTLAALAGTSSNWSDTTLCMRILGGTLLNLATSWKVALRIVSGSLDVNAGVVLRTLPGSTTVIDSTPVTFNSGASYPQTLSAGDVVSDAISLALDNDHDYYVLLFFPTSGNNSGVTLSNAASFGNDLTTGKYMIAAGYFNGVDETTATTIGSISSPTNIYGWLWVRSA